ncbi:MAG: chlorophyll synthesis pathway protein BchC [Rhodobacteraceae bacterium]|nr:chlorophyll synthesis pathway protein BchC [Paracoccaceae bacterium]
MQTTAVLLAEPKMLGLETVALKAPAAGDVVVDVAHSGISTGTEKLFYSGDMPPFPGSGFPLVPGYEATGTVVEAAGDLSVGDTVFVPGADCYEEAFGLFGGSAKTLVTPASRVTRIDFGHGAAGALLALAATARHALASPNASLPDLIVGHGTLGRLLARLTIAAGAPAPTVWEIDPSRSVAEYPVVHPDQDDRRDYGAIYDASGDAKLLNALIGRLKKGGEITLAGFYADPLSFAFPPAFMKEARLRVAAEWTAEDMTATRDLVEAGKLRLDNLITHRAAATDAPQAYETAFSDPSCLKMILDWRDIA